MSKQIETVDTLINRRGRRAERAEGKRLLRTRDVTSEFGIPESTLEKQRLRGDGIPFLKIGRAVYYDRAEIEKTLAARLRRSTSDGQGGGEGEARTE